MKPSNLRVLVCGSAHPDLPTALRLIHPHGPRTLVLPRHGGAADQAERLGIPSERRRFPERADPTMILAFRPLGRRSRKIVEAAKRAGVWGCIF